MRVIELSKLRNPIVPTPNPEEQTGMVNKNYMKEKLRGELS